METVTDFINLDSKITADGDCNHEIKRCLLLGRKVMTNLDSILKSRDITLPTKVHLVKAMIFPVVMYVCENSEVWGYTFTVMKTDADYSEVKSARFMLHLNLHMMMRFHSFPIYY